MSLANLLARSQTHALASAGGTPRYQARGPGSSYGRSSGYGRNRNLFPTLSTPRSR